VDYIFLKDMIASSGSFVRCFPRRKRAWGWWQCAQADESSVEKLDYTSPDDKR